MKIIFMGTPEFACPTLQNLLADPDFEVVAVYSREPQISGRGHKLTNSPVHELALKHGLPVITPKTLRNTQVQEEFRQFNADAAVVVAYGLILPSEILQATKFGCINLHPSLLPRWRGPAPIQYTLFAGDDEIGVTIIQMDAGIDSGAMIMQQKFALQQKDNYSNLAPRLAQLGANMIAQSLKDLRDGKVLLSEQNHALATFSKKLEKSQSQIDWNLSAEEILRKIRGLSGLLTAYFEIDGEKIKIYEAEIIEDNHEGNSAKMNMDGVQKNTDNSTKKKCGEIVDDRFTIQCGKNQIRPLVLQRQGKNQINIDDFLRGFKK